MASIVRTGAWRELWDTGQLGRFVLLCIGVWLHAADTLVTATIVPAVVDDIGGVAYVAWTISLYQIGAIVAGAATALLCQRIGVKRVLLISALLYGAGCVAAAMAPNMAILLGARLAQGAAGGMLISLSYVAIQQSFAEHLWGRLFGVISVIWGAGSFLGPLIGGVFVHFGTWRGAFWFFALQAGLLWAVAAALLENQPPERGATGKFPVLPMLILTAAALMIAEAGVTGESTTALVLVLAGLVLLYAAARLDGRSVEKMLPAQVLDIRHPVGAGLLMVFALSVGTTGFWAYGPLLLKTLFGTDPLVSSYILVGESLAWTAGTMLVTSAPVSADKMLIRSGAACAAIGAAGFAIVVPAGSLAGMVVCGLLQGLGFGLFWPVVAQRMARFADQGERGLASAAPVTLQRIGYAIGAAACGIAANASGLADGISVSAAKTAGFWVFAGFVPILIVGMVGAWWFTSEAGTRQSGRVTE
jgi:MFS family permease